MPYILTTKTLCEICAGPSSRLAVVTLDERKAGLLVNKQANRLASGGSISLPDGTTIEVEAVTDDKLKAKLTQAQRDNLDAKRLSLIRLGEHRSTSALDEAQRPDLCRAFNEQEAAKR